MVNSDRTIVTAPNVGTDWRSDEVMEALGIVFRNKCYICERTYPSPYHFAVDHFITQSEDGTLIYVWTNLYLCCHHCNGARAKKTPIGAYLDPCNPADDVEKAILYDLAPYEFDKPTFLPADTNPSDKVKNTIHQLKKCHYGSRKTSMKYAAIREVIANQAKKLITLILESKNASEANDRITEAQRNAEIEDMLSVDAPFTMLMRSVAERYK